jgi:Ceramidase
MDSIGKIFAYCERGFDPSFWGEPFNALSNLGFILAGLLALRELAARPASEAKAFRYALVLLVFVIGIGSFLFHTYAEPWAATADVAPIGLFMLAYFGYALYRYVGLPLWIIPPALAGFATVIGKGMQLQCWGGQVGFSLPVPAAENTTCLNGSAGYLPALAAMLLIGGLLAARRHPTAPYVLAASMVLMVSLTFRTMDRLWCQDVSLAGRAIGTHFLWHLLNSVTLYLLLLAAIRHGAYGAAPARRHGEERAA